MMLYSGRPLRIYLREQGRARPCACVVRRTYAQDRLNERLDEVLVGHAVQLEEEDDDDGALGQDLE
jgi:hypothetical protein